MSHVTGFIDGVAYTAVIDRAIAKGDPDAVGIVTGSPNVLALLDLHKGVEVDAPLPGAEPVTVNVSDARSVVAALHSLTTVHDTSADAPDIFGQERPSTAGTVY